MECINLKQMWKKYHILAIIFLRDLKKYVYLCCALNQLATRAIFFKYITQQRKGQF